jgi:hypothetical protein
MRNPKSEIRMTNQARMTKSELFRHLPFVIRHLSLGHSDLIRHSDFGFRILRDLGH